MRNGGVALRLLYPAVSRHAGACRGAEGSFRKDGNAAFGDVDADAVAGREAGVFQPFPAHPQRRDLADSGPAVFVVQVVRM